MECQPPPDSSGSSPRLRGTPATICTRCARSRFIPASAGNTTMLRESPGRKTVHPRVCGEHTSQQVVDAIATGSSPRLRGTRCPSDGCCSGLRFIPASAGNTEDLALAADQDSVHPRVCGEHTTRTAPSRCSSGSSPRLRGTLPRRPDARGGERFIPASAGNTQ